MATCKRKNLRRASETVPLTRVEFRSAFSDGSNPAQVREGW